MLPAPTSELTSPSKIILKPSSPKLPTNISARAEVFTNDHVETCENELPECHTTTHLISAEEMNHYSGDNDPDVQTVDQIEQMKKKLTVVQSSENGILEALVAHLPNEMPNEVPEHFQTESEVPGKGVKRPSVRPTQDKNPVSRKSSSSPTAQKKTKLSKPPPPDGWLGHLASQCDPHEIIVRSCDLKNEIRQKLHNLTAKTEVKSMEVAKTQTPIQRERSRTSSLSSNTGRSRTNSMSRTPQIARATHTRSHSCEFKNNQDDLDLKDA